jgi:large subunit ribosomal protein L2
MIIKKLLYNKKNFSGKNNSGKIMVKSRCMGHKKKYKFINFKINSIFLNGIIIKLEKISNKNSSIALINFNLDKFFSPYLLNYILATKNMQIGSIFIKNKFSLYNNIMLLTNIKKGMVFNQIESQINRGSQYTRAAGTYSKLRYKSNTNVCIILPSKKEKIFFSNCFAILGVLNIFHTQKLLKAGFSKLIGKRPHVRGVAMNIVDHPNGGGRGKSKSNKHLRSPFGLLSKGKKTVKKK